jgi:hypothetical protein
VRCAVARTENRIDSVRYQVAIGIAEEAGARVQIREVQIALGAPSGAPPGSAFLATFGRFLMRARDHEDTRLSQRGGKNNLQLLEAFVQKADGGPLFLFSSGLLPSLVLRLVRRASLLPCLRIGFVWLASFGLEPLPLLLCDSLNRAGGDVQVFRGDPEVDAQSS